jgi:hypothetical protein
VADPRARHLARLRWLRRSARWWTVTAGGLVGAAVVLLPYEGIGLPDAFWAAGAGGSVAIAFWRWADLRSLAAEPVPEPITEAARAARNQQRLERLVGRLPIGRAAIGELHRVQHLSKLRGSAVAEAGSRLDRAAKSLTGLGARVGADVLDEAMTAEHALRDLAERAAAVERVLRLPATTAGHRDHLVAAHADMVAQLTDGVGAYEGFVTAAASVVAENGLLGEPIAKGRLTEASDKLRGMAEALAEFTSAARRQQA